MYPESEVKGVWNVICWENRNSISRLLSANHKRHQHNIQNWITFPINKMPSSGIIYTTYHTTHTSTNLCVWVISDKLIPRVISGNIISYVYSFTLKVIDQDWKYFRRGQTLSVWKLDDLLFHPWVTELLKVRSFHHINRWRFPF